MIYVALLYKVIDECIDALFDRTIINLRPMECSELLEEGEYYLIEIQHDDYICQYFNCYVVSIERNLVYFNCDEEFIYYTPQTGEFKPGICDGEVLTHQDFVNRYLKK